jgi:hypothetical protein
MRRATDLIGKSLYQEGRMITHSGILFNLLNPDPDDILIEDIAVHLSRIARWNGGTHQFYSVAEHCCRCCDAAEGEDKLMMLLHDAEEAYWGDIISTVKSILKKVAPEITDKMKALRVLIFEKFGIPILDKIDVLLMGTIDKMELQNDFTDLIINRKRDCWSPERAESEFLTRFYDLKNLGNAIR